MLGNSISLKIKASEAKGGEEFIVTCGLNTFIEFERKFKKPITKVFTDAAEGALSVENIVWLGWHAAKKAGHIVPVTIDEWTDSWIEGIDFVEEEQTAPL
jgi:hypothetical protein